MNNRDTEDCSSSSNSTDSDVSTDEETLLETFPLSNNDSEDMLLDISLDPRIPVSDHEGDNELSTVGYGSCDTDEETEDQPETRENVDEWCQCGNCRCMNTTSESYCCKESEMISSILNLSESTCVTDLEIFKTAIACRDVLELSVYGLYQERVPKDTAGNIKPELTELS